MRKHKGVESSEQMRKLRNLKKFGKQVSYPFVVKCEPAEFTKTGCWKVNTYRLLHKSRYLCPVIIVPF